MISSADSLTRFADWLAQLPALPQPQILDLGCGAAHCAHALQARWPDATLWGVDQNVAILQRAPSFVHTMQADIRRLPFGAQQFGLLVMRHPDAHRQPDAWRCAVEAMPRLLCDGGCLLVTCYTLPEAERMNGWLRTRLTTGKQLILHRDLVRAADQVSHDRFALAWQLC